MEFSLPAEVAAAGYRLAAFETIGSTSREAMARARAGELGPLWLVTDHQSAGTGRRGAAWQTPRGNLAASLLLTTDLPPATIATLGFAAGLALVRALDAPPSPEGRTESAKPTGVGTAGRGGQIERGDPTPVALTRKWALPSGEGDPRFTLKWPNDVLADGAKLAGILLQTETVASRPGPSRPERAVVIGIGVNVAAAPGGLPYRAASLAGLGREADAAALFCALASAWLEAHRVWDDGRGFEAVREAWIGRAAGLGGDVAIRTGEQTTRGVFETIDEHGQLVLRTSDGVTRRISAGEVHFGRAATARTSPMEAA